MKNTKKMHFRYRSWLAFALCICMMAMMAPSRIVHATELDTPNEEIGAQQPGEDIDGTDLTDESGEQPAEETGTDEQPVVDDEQPSDTDAGEADGTDVQPSDDDANVIGQIGDQGDDTLPPVDDAGEADDADPSESYDSPSGEYEGIGQIELPDTTPEDVISMVLPVMSNDIYNFTMDPGEILRYRTDVNVLAEGATVYFSHGGDLSVLSPFSDVAYASSRSTVPVQLRVEIQVENHTYADIVCSPMNEVFEGNEPRVAFAIVPTGAGFVSGNETAGNSPLIKNKLVSTGTDGHAALNFYLPSMEENYEIVEVQESDSILRQYRYEPIENAQWPTVGFSVAGNCNKNASWGDLASAIESGQNLTLRVIYRMEVMEEEKEARIESGEIAYDPETGTISE